jgi:hypothetical protein
LFYDFRRVRMMKKKMRREKEQQRKMNYRLFHYSLFRGWGGYSIIELGGGEGMNQSFSWTSWNLLFK